MPKEEDNKALAMMSSRKDVSLTMPLGLAIQIFSLAQVVDEINEPYKDDLVRMKKEVASQLVG